MNQVQHCGFVTVAVLAVAVLAVAVLAVAVLAVAVLEQVVFYCKSVFILIAMCEMGYGVKKIFFVGVGVGVGVGFLSLTYIDLHCLTCLLCIGSIHMRLHSSASCLDRLLLPPRSMRGGGAV